MNKKWYTVTAKAGEYVAGQRVPENKKMLLSERQAEHDLRLGNLEVFDVKAAAEKAGYPTKPKK